MNRSSLLLATALLLACGRSSPPDVVPFDTPGWARFARAGDLVIGGQPSPDGLRELADLGYTTVISTRTTWELDWDERATVEGLGMRFVRIPMPLPVSPVTASQVAALDSVLAQSPGKTLLHCTGGTRAAVLWAEWLAKTRGVNADTVLARAEQAGIKLSHPAVDALLGRAAATPSQ